MKFFKRTDLVIILSIVLISAASWGIYNYLHEETPAKAEIYYYSELVKTVELGGGEDRTFSIPQNENVVFRLYQDGSIAFAESDCPDKVCIHAGKLRRSGQFAACLPNGIVMKIVPQGTRGGEDTDLVLGN